MDDAEEDEDADHRWVHSEVFSLKPAERKKKKEKEKKKEKKKKKNKRKKQKTKNKKRGRGNHVKTHSKTMGLLPFI